MSEDEKKKRDRALQRRVRDRQAKTGESYQAAWRQLTGSDAPATEPTDDAPTESVPADAPEAPESDTVKQLLAAASALGLGSDTHVGMSPPTSMSRDALVSWLILPLHLPRVLPHQPARVTARAKESAVDLDRIIISGTGTAGGAGDWVVNDIEIDGRSQLATKDLSGALFSARGVAASQKASTTFSMEGFDPVEYDHELVIVVTYIGPNPEGVPFFASAMGTPPPQRPTIVSITSNTPLSTLTRTTIGARIENAPFQANFIEIEEGWDWIVNDLRINGRTQFAQSGDIPGDMFATGAIAAFVSLEECEAGDEIEIDVTYIGATERAIFKGRLEGTVIRDDYKSPPPDLRVIVRTGDKISSEAVIATCNWRRTP